MSIQVKPAVIGAGDQGFTAGFEVAFSVVCVMVGSVSCVS